tara:strand:- start:462 stop:974 length:513 start_codon:yes stop_codon:yes gene_type:complete
MQNLEKLISTYENFPQAGVSFRDVMEIAQHPSIFRKLISDMAKNKIIEESEAIISIDARGFIFGSALSLKASKPMIVARKPGKLPGELVTKKYSLEYGENSLSIQKKALKKYDSYAIIDDLLATGGTVNCVSDLLKMNNKKVAGLLVVVELSKLDGRSRFNFPVESSIIL